MATLSVLDVTARFLQVNDKFPVGILLLCFFRYWIHLVLAVIIAVRRKTKVRSSRAPFWQIFRGVTMLGGTVALFLALSRVTQAETTAIKFLAPVFVIFSAPLILKERFKFHRLGGIAISFVGVLLISRPGAGADFLGVSYALCAALMMSLQYIASRKVSVDDPYLTLVWSGTVGVILVVVWSLVTRSDIIQELQGAPTPILVLLASTGLIGLIGHLLQIKAYWHEEASVLAPFIYLQIIFAALFGYLINQDSVGMLSWVGVILISGSGFLAGLREVRRAKLH